MTETIRSKESGQANFRIEAERNGEAYVVRLGGELDIATVPEAREAIQHADRDGAARIVLDIDALTFIDSEGLALMVEATRQDGAAGRLTVTRGTGQVADLLSLTGLDQALPLTDGAANGQPARSPAD